MTYNQRLLQRRDTLVNWINSNPILLDGELGFIEINGNYTQMVIGDGKRSFNNLPKIKLNFDEPVTRIKLDADEFTICSYSTNSSSIVANKNLFPWVEDDYFIF